jgi:hypothetical protein
MDFKFKVAAGILFYNDKESLRRTLTSLSHPEIDIIFALDGRFPNYPLQEGCEALSTDGSREMIKTEYGDKTILVDAPLIEFKKRQKYLELCGQYNCNLLIIIDSDEFVWDEVSYWEYFRRECYDKIILESKEEHNIFNMKMFTNLSVCGGIKLDLWIDRPRLWYKPYEVRYGRGRHFEFIDREGILQTGGEGKPTVNSVRLKHDDALRTQEHLDGRLVYQAWLRDYEASMQAKELNDQLAQLARERASFTC